MTVAASDAVNISVATTDSSRKLRLGALTAIVIGSMVGSGVFSLPQNMAAGAGPLAILIGWGITGSRKMLLQTAALTVDVGLNVTGAAAFSAN